MNNIENQFNVVFKEELCKEKINFDVSNDWKKFAKKSLHITSPRLSGISTIEFLKLYDILESENEILNCYEFAILNENIEIRSQKELETSNRLEYSAIMIIVESYAKLWNEQTLPIKTQVIEKLTPKNGNLKTIQGNFK